MAKTKVEVLNAVVDGATRGEQIVIDSRSAAHLERIGYVKVIGEAEESEHSTGLSIHTVAELKEMAASFEVEGYDSMKKAELIEAIENAEKE